MNKHQKLEVESLLKQMSLTEPPVSLDRRIRQIAAGQTSSAPVISGRFGWTALVSTAVAAALFGVVMGVVGSRGTQGINEILSTLGPSNSAVEDMGSIDSGQLRTVALFQEMHGHSNRMEYKACSNCHLFDSKERQILKKWKHDLGPTEDHPVFGQKCSLCHAS